MNIGNCGRTSTKRKKKSEFESVRSESEWVYNMRSSDLSAVGNKS